MPRPPRIADPDAVWHVVTRGNRGQHIFRDTSDRLDFLARLRRVCDRHEWQLHAYCLMGTHYHLLVALREASLSAGVHQLNSGHAHMHNRRHAVEGHVFERRFWSRDVRTEPDLLTAARYVELNPVRAGLVRHPREWRWSSYRAHAALDVAPPFLTDTVCRVFARDHARGRRAWCAYVDAGLEELGAAA